MSRGGPYVELPAEVTLGLRHPTPLLLDLEPPEPPGARPADPPSAAASGAAAAHAVVALLDRLATAVDLTPVPLLASGGIGVRELRRLGDLAGTGHAETATLLELAEILGLLKVMSKEVRLTKAWDAWTARGPADRWARLAHAWNARRSGPTRAPAKPARCSRPTATTTTPGCGHAC